MIAYNLQTSLKYGYYCSEMQYLHELYVRLSIADNVVEGATCFFNNIPGNKKRVRDWLRASSSANQNHYCGGAENMDSNERRLLRHISGLQTSASWTQKPQLWRYVVLQQY